MLAASHHQGSKGLLLAPGTLGAGPNLPEDWEESPDTGHQTPATRSTGAHECSAQSAYGAVGDRSPHLSLQLPHQQDLTRKLRPRARPHPPAQGQDSLHVASDSSEPSEQSSSPSHFHRSRMQWPSLQVKSLSAQVFLAVGQGEEHEGPGRHRKLVQNIQSGLQGDQNVLRPQAGPRDLPWLQERNLFIPHQEETGSPWPCSPGSTRVTASNHQGNASSHHTSLFPSSPVPLSQPLGSLP